MNRFLLLALLLIGSISLAACGGGTTSAVPSTVTYKLSIQGNVPADAIKGIQFEVVLPAGITVKYDAASGKTLPGSVEASPSISVAKAGIESTFSSSDRVLGVGLLTATGIGPGEFALVTCDVLPGEAAPPATALTVRNVKAVDGSTATVNGVAVTIK